MANSGSKSVSVTSWDTLKFSWEETSQDIAKNQTTISWKLQLIATSSGYIASTASKDWSVTVDGTKYSGTNTIGINNNSTKTLASGSTTITHDSDGTKTFSYSFSQEIAITFSGSYIGTKSGSGSGTLDTIPRKSSMSVENGTLGTAQTLTVTRQATSFTHTIVAECGSKSKTVASKSTSTSISFTPPLDWATENTTGTSVSVNYTITTYNGDTSVGSNSYTKTCSIPSSVAPTCSLTVTDPTGNADMYGSFVKGLSKFKVVVTPKTAQGSPIASYSTTANGSTYTAASFTTELLKTTGTLTVKATVKDKRGRSGSASVSKSVLDYTPPTVSKLTVHRCDANGTENDQGEYVKVVFSAAVTALNNKNTAAYKLRYKKTTASSFTTVTFSPLANTYKVTGHSYIFAGDSNASYDVEVEVADNHGTYTRSTSASTAFTLMNWGPTGDNMAIFKVAEKPGYLEIGQKVEVENPIELAGNNFQELTITSNFKLYGDDEDNQPKAYKNAAGMVEIVGRLSPAATLSDIGATAGVLMFTLPVGFRPLVSFTALEQGSSSAVWLITVETNGNVKASRYRKGDTYEVPDTGAWLTFHQVFFAK